MKTMSKQLDRGMLAFAKGVTGGGELTEGLKTLNEGLSNLAIVGESAGKLIGDSFSIVAEVFRGVWAVGSTIVDVLVEMFGGDSRVSLAEYLDETKKLKLDFAALKTMALNFAESASIAFAWVGDKVSQYLVDPIEFFIGMFIKGVAVIMKGVEKLISMLPDFVLPDGFEESVKNATKSISDLGTRIADHAVEDHFAGDKMTERTKKFFAGLHDKVDAGEALGGKKQFAEKMGVSTNTIAMDWVKSVREMTSLHKDLEAEMRAELKARQEKHDDELRTEAKKLSDAAINPADKFRSKMLELHEMQDKGLIDRRELGVAASDAFKSLISALPSYSSNTVIRAGSEEAQRTVMENRRGGGMSVQDILRQSVQVQKDLKALQQQMLDKIDAAVVVPIGVS